MVMCVSLEGHERTYLGAMAMGAILLSGLHAADDGKTDRAEKAMQRDAPEKDGG